MALFSGLALAQGGATATGQSSSFNPAFGVNGLFTAAHTDRDATEGAFDSGFHIQEVEFGMSAVVDPFFKAQMTVAIEEGEDFNLEEFYVTATHMPLGLGLQIGKTFQPMGKHNRLHTHAYPFLDGPWINQVLLGEEGLNEIGVQLSYLPPLNWYSEFTLNTFTPGDDGPFIKGEDKKLGFTGNWRNLWDISDDTTLDLGVSYSGGKGAADRPDLLTQPFVMEGDGPVDLPGVDEEGSSDYGVWGMDLTFKHVSNNYHSWDTGLEYLAGRASAPNADAITLDGLTAYVRAQMSRRWWAQVRGDWLGFENDFDHGVDLDGAPRLRSGDLPQKYSFLVAFVMSEFTAVRLQYAHIDRIVEPVENQVALQMNVTFGAHPAHSY